MVKVVNTQSGNFVREEKAFLAKRALEKMRERSEEEYAAALAQRASLGYADLNITPINTDFVFLVPAERAKSLRTGVFFRRGRTIYAAIVDPNNSKAKIYIEELAKENGWTVIWYIVSQSSMDRLLQRYDRITLFDSLDKMKVRLSESDFDSFQKRFSEIFALKKDVLSMSVSETFSLIVGGAVSLEASDIHLEPQEKQVRLRYRLDGVLQDVGMIPKESYQYVISRVKMLSKMKLNVRKSAQDGRFSFTIASEKEGVNSRKIDIRASILPSRHGETIVMRVLEQKNVFLEMTDLGLRGSAYEGLREEIQKTSGMIITTGPTGSGKTTLLYSILNQLNRSDVKIITIEDPVEYEVANVSQTNVSKENGYTFATGLRAIVRQDPDIVLVGEIRDEETADVAVQSSLTGHLVLSTLHTNSAAGSIPRLLNLGVKPSLIPSSANAFVAQRLVRRLCDHCKEAYVPAKRTLEIIAKLLALISPKAKLSVPDELETLYRSKGCEKCNYTGYKGRVGIFEVLFMTETISKLTETMASESEILMTALEEGMVTMTQDGILKAVEGITSMEEVWRVSGQMPFLEGVYEKLMARQIGNALFVSQEMMEKVQSVSVVEAFDAFLSEEPAEEKLAFIIAYALELGCEDIHIEPEEEMVAVRFRIDGVLQPVAHIATRHYPAFLGKVKLLSGLKTEEQAGLQDSRFTIDKETEGGKKESVDVRVSIILGGYGETAVLRLLNIGAQAKSFASLGMRKETQDALEAAIKIPNGIILTTGPTGSGKSTTLYSILSKLNEPNRKIMTVEDPIEYRMSGVLQTQVNESKGYTFSTALRSLLRQNPEIILVGEVRDEETAQIAVQSSLTGHLVFSTLHTNDAPSAVQRLINMHISTRDLAGSLSFIMAQRLVRLLCSCKMQRPITEEERREMKAIYAPYARAAGKALPDMERVYEPKGCEKCRGTGYSGMAMISEGMNMKNPAIQTAILENASLSELQRIAVENGMVPMVVDGIDKVLSGETSLEEIRRVTEL
jgi:type IV pilus assembly protein PilB